MVKVSHIPLAQRKAICGRLVFLAAAYPERSKFVAAGAGLQFDQVRDNLVGLTKQELEDSDDQEALDAYLRRLFKDLGSQMQPQLQGKYGTQFQRLAADMRAGVQSISCRQCTPIQGHICNGGDRDDEIVRDSGVCIAPLRTMFDAAAAAANKWYASSCNLFDPATSRKIVFSTSFTNSKPHDIPGDYFVGAATTELAGPPLTAQIELSLWPQKFDWKTYAATLYVLFHECICHAFQGMRPVRAGLRNDGFAEGWMDWIAFECFLRHLKFSPGTATLRSHRDSGTQFHLLRVDYDREDRSRDSFIRAFGKSVAERFFHLLERLPQSWGDPWTNLLMFSFDANVVDGLSDRDLQVLNGCLPDEEGRGAPEMELVVDALRKYLTDKDIYDFLQVIWGLKLFT